MSFVRKIILIPLLFIFGAISAQDFMLQGFYWDYPGTLGIQTWSQAYLTKIPELQQSGFTYIWLPPLSRSSSGIQSVGYDVKDYYDLGEYGLGPTCFGTRKNVDTMIATLKRAGIHPVADMIFNQRAGGAYERNDHVKAWIENYTGANGDLPYPSDRVRAYILLNDSTKNGSGTYYVDFQSKTHGYAGEAYTVVMWTHKVPYVPADSLTDSYEVEPNQGGKCGNGPGDTANTYMLGARKYCTIDTYSADNCGIDEFKLKLDTSMYDVTGDTLFFTWNNQNATGNTDFADQCIIDIWHVPADTTIKAGSIDSELVYQTGTDFTHLPSGRGPMTEANFKPNGNATCLCGDWDGMLFFYDIDQFVPSTQQTLIDWTEWMFDTIGIEGVRLDAVKNYEPGMVVQLLDSLHNHGHNPGMVVGEYYDGNPCDEAGYINSVQNALSTGAGDSINMRLFDFTLRYGLKSACDEYGFDERQLFSQSIRDGSGSCGAISGRNVVTFCSNHDFRDGNSYPNNPIQYNPELAYCYLLTNNQLGLPCVFESDFFDPTGAQFLKGRIKGLMAAEIKYIHGSNSVTYLNNYNSTYATYFTDQAKASTLETTTIVYQLNSPPNNHRQVIVAINFAGDSLDAYQQLVMDSLAVGDTLTDIFGVTDTLTTITANHEVHIKLPPRSFAIYVQGNLKDSLLSLADTTVAVKDTTGITASPVKQSTIHVSPNPFSNVLNVQMDAPVSGNVIAEIWDADGRKVYSKTFVNGVNSGFQFDPGINVAGFYMLKVSANSQEQYFKLIKH